MTQRTDAVAYLKQFFEVFGNHQNGGAGVSQFDQRAMDGCRCADIDAPGRVCGDQQFRLLQDLAAEDEFLQVAAGEATRRGVDARRLYSEGINDAPGERFDMTVPYQPVDHHAGLLESGKQAVVSQTHVGDRAMTESLGWALVLPQMLAMLGLVFADAGVGKAVAHLTTAYINMDYRLVAVVVYCVGMALFTVIMGNGFAAFPVMTGGVGVPILVGVFHANPAVMAAIGMFSGYCGTLMTPMAANFNIVPAALLELSDKNAVIKAQVPTALLLLAANIVLLYFLMLH